MSTRPRVSLKAKRRTLLACVIIVAAALLFFGPGERSLACPAPPMPLRPLYMASQSVVVARADKSVILQTEKIDPESDYDRTLLRTTFYVSQTLKSKGEEEQVVHVYTWLWGEDRMVPEYYAEGTRLLLFLGPREEGEGYELVDDSYGAKDLPDDVLKVYVERLEELDRILRAAKPDKAEIAEWLVRCVEEPATRWEGAYDLYISQDFLKREIEVVEGKTAGSEQAAVAENPSDEEVAPVEVVEETGEEARAGETVVETEEISPYSGDMARFLTSEQKKRLADVLFSQPEFMDEDWPLFTLVQGWGDERLQGFILSYLEKVKDNPGPYAHTMVNALAELLKDEKLAAMARRFSDYSSYKEDEPPAGGVDKGEKAGREPDALAGGIVEKRSTRLKKFLTEARSVISNQIAMSVGDSQ